MPVYVLACVNWPTRTRGGKEHGRDFSVVSQLEPNPVLGAEKGKGMSGGRTGLTKLAQQLGELSEAFVLLDETDKDGVALIQDRLSELARLARAANKSAFRTTASEAADLLGRALRAAPDRLGAALEAVGLALRRLQAILAGRGTGAACCHACESESATASSDQDAEILREFLQRQDAVLAQIDEALSRLNKKAEDRAAAGALHRLFHRLKGDSAMLGLRAMAELCAAGCEAIDKGSPAGYLTPLQRARAWLGAASAALRNGEDYACDAALLAALAPGADTANEAAGHAAPVQPDGAGPAGHDGPGPEPPTVAADTEPAATPDDGRAGMANGYEIREMDLVRDFIAEATEHLESADQQLLILENDPSNAAALDTVFRSFHTIKGMAGFLGLPPIIDLAHQCETLLDAVKRGQQRFEGAAVQASFGAVDMLRAMTADLSRDIGTGNLFFCREDVAGLIRQIKHVLGERAEAEVSAGVGGGVMVDAGASSVSRGAGGTGMAQQWIRVDAEKIDGLLDTIGELVIAESVVAGDPALASLKARGLDKNLTHLTKITRSLQDMATSMRMIPIEGLFRRMARLARDLAKQEGKRIHLSVEGKETELDRSMIERLSDPLVHLLRNAIDHGIEESEDVRRAAGKSAEGRLWLRAYHRGGSVHIEVADDGRGLDAERIAAGALARGVLEETHGLSEQEIFALIFAPGFSTAETVTSVSGRGVGMDVVKRSVEGLRGNVLVDSKPGAGATFELVLPLTTAIIDGMAAMVGAETYVVPLLSIVECVRPTADMLSSVLDRGELIAFRGALLPLFRLSRLFESASAIDDPCEAIVMIVEDSGRRAGLLVDALLGQQQTVIKSLGEGLGQTPGISGASIMADGRPGLILDVAGIVKLATSGARSEGHVREHGSKGGPRDGEERDAGDGEERYAGDAGESGQVPDV